MIKIEIEKNKHPDLKESDIGILITDTNIKDKVIPINVNIKDFGFLSKEELVKHLIKIINHCIKQYDEIS